MKLRAALYARYSSDNQSEASVPDQLASCRRLAERLGAHVVREFSDEGISGTSMVNRPGVRDLMAFVRAGGCDIVIAEHTNRLSRDGEDGWGIYNRLKALGVRYTTVEQNDVTILDIGFDTVMSELKIEEGRHKTRRGMRGRVEAGLNVATPSYGYRKKRVYDAAGEPVRGLLEIDVEKAEIVRGIFRDYADGVSPWAIAHALTEAGVPSPRNRRWIASAIAGHPRTGRGIVFNEIYRGVRVWGKKTSTKDRDTGGRLTRDQVDPAEILRIDVPELRLIEDDLWDAVQLRHAQIARPRVGGRVAGRPKRFLQGLTVCGECGSPMNLAGPADNLRCAARKFKDGCTNKRTPSYAAIEARVFAALNGNLLHPDVVEHAIRKIQEGLRAAAKDAGRRQAKDSAEAAELARRMNRLVDQVEEGVPWSLLAPRHAELAAKQEALRASLEATPTAEVVEMLPSAARLYRQHVERLRATIANPGAVASDRDREAVRGLIEAIRITSLPGKGKYELEVVGDLAPLFDLDAAAERPLAAEAGRRQVMSKLDVGTRISRRHKLSVPFVQAA